MVKFFQADPLNNIRTVLPRTTKFGRITHAAEELFKKLAAPFHFHKCVARFVSDS